MGGYSVHLGSVNPNLVANVYPQTWTNFEYTNALGLPTSGRGRLAIRYFIPMGGSNGSNGDYIGIDRMVVKAGAPSYAVRGSVTGLSDEPVVLWLNGHELVNVASDGAFAFTRKLDQGTPYSVSVYAEPEGRQCVVTNGVGTMGASDVGDVLVACAVD